MVDGVRDHGSYGHFRASASGCGHGVNLDRSAQALEVTRQLVKRLGVVGRHGDRLGGIHRRATTKGDDGVAALVLVEINTFLHQRNRRVGGDFVKHHKLRTTCGQCIGQALEQTQLGDDAVGDDQDLAVPKSGYGLAEAAA